MKTFLLGESRAAAQKDRAELRRCEILRLGGLSSALVVGRQLDGKCKLRKVFKLWLSGVPSWWLKVELCHSKGGVELLWPGDAH